MGALNTGQSNGKARGRGGGNREEQHCHLEQKKTNKAKKQTNPQDAFATRHRYNLDNLYLNIVVSTQALTDRCFDLESVVSVRYFHYVSSPSLSRCLVCSQIKTNMGEK